jgi:hypothetical protein
LLIIITAGDFWRNVNNFAVVGEEVNKKAIFAAVL